MTSGDRCSAVGQESISVTWVWFRCLRWQLGPWWCLQYCVSPCQVEFCRTVQCIDRRAFEAAFGSRAGSDLGKTTFARLPTSMRLCHSDSVLENDLTRSPKTLAQEMASVARRLIASGSQAIRGCRWKSTNLFPTLLGLSSHLLRGAASNFGWTSAANCTAREIEFRQH